MVCYGFFDIQSLPRLIGGVLLFGVLTSCGDTSGPANSSIGKLPAVSIEDAPRFAQGPIGTACNIHNRGRAGASRCGCVQAAANLTLSQSQQQRATRFFAEPELLQQIKLSDTPENERFWYTWAQFAETAERMCR